MGAVNTAKFFLKNGIDKFAVSRIEEGVILRENGIDCEILALCSTAEREEIDQILDYRLTASVGSFDALSLLNNKAMEKKKVSDIHIKIDTGFGRYGFSPEELSKLVDALKEAKNINITGVFTHLSDAFGRNLSHSQKQFTLFESSIKFLKDSGIELGIRHVLNSNGLFRFPQNLYDGVRIGSAFTGRVLCGRGLSPVGTLQATVQEIRRLPKGHNVGYGNACKLKKDTVIAILPVGTADGLGMEKAKGLFRLIDKLRYIKEDLLLSNKKRIHCKIGGRNAYILGRPCMTSLMIDVTDIPCKPGDICLFSVNPMMINASIERNLI